MNRKRVAALVFASLALWGCNKKTPADSADQGARHGRYSGVGLYNPSPQWTKLIGAHQAKDAQLAQSIDDQVIIVVQDSITGEVRACGDLRATASA
jgi:hypothetical protein